MTRSSGLLGREVVEVAKRELKKLGKYAYVGKKLQAVIAASEHGITEVAKIYNISRTTLTSWVKHIKEASIKKLEAPENRKRKSKLNDNHKRQIKGWIANNPNITISQVRLEIENKFGITLSMATVHRAIKSIGMSYITARPRHYKQDAALVAEFKKNLATNPDLL